MQRACLYCIAGSRFVFSPESRTVAGFWTVEGQPIALSSSASDSELGDAAVACLMASRQRVPTPPRDERPELSALLAACEARTWIALMRKATLVSIEKEGSKIRVVPYERRGPRRGYARLDAAAIEEEDRDAERLGAALRAALRLCT